MKLRSSGTKPGSRSFGITQAGIPRSTVVDERPSNVFIGTWVLIRVYCSYSRNTGSSSADHQGGDPAPDPGIRTDDTEGGRTAPACRSARRLGLLVVGEPLGTYQRSALVNSTVCPNSSHFYLHPSFLEILTNAIPDLIPILEIDSSTQLANPIW